MASNPPDRPVAAARSAGLVRAGVEEHPPGQVGTPPPDRLLVQVVRALTGAGAVTVYPDGVLVEHVEPNERVEPAGHVEPNERVEPTGHVEPAGHVEPTG